MQNLLAILEILQIDQLLGQGVESLVQTTNGIEILGVLLGSSPEGDNDLCFLHLLLLHLPPQIPVSRLKFKSQGPNPSTGSPDPNLEAQISASRSKSQPRGLIPTSRLRFGPQG